MLKKKNRNGAKKFQGLEPGYSYEYEVHAEIVRDGEIIEDVRTVHLTAGAREAVAFGFNPEFTESLAALP